MATGLLRTTFNRSELVRILSETTPPDIARQYDFGERLGKWLDFTDALTLYPVLNRETGAGVAAGGGRPASLSGQLARVRQALAESILDDGVFNREARAHGESALPEEVHAARVPFPTPLPGEDAAGAADFAPYHRYYLAHQRDMGNAIGALRTAARKALAEKSLAHRQLADLDAAFQEVLAARERNLLATIPMHLGKRFDERYRDHLDALPPGADDNPSSWTAAGSWLEGFCHDTQAVLLAELDLRLKPVAGLIAALEDTDPTQGPLQ